MTTETDSPEVYHQNKFLAITIQFYIDFLNII